MNNKNNKANKSSYINLRVTEQERDLIKRNAGGNVSKFLIELGTNRANRIDKRIVIQDPALVHQVRRIGISLNTLIREVNIRKQNELDIEFMDVEAQLVIANQQLSDLILLGKRK
ncbi:hypothetical protein VXS02_18235 [Photobacterium piscicola]|uniref:plasmid mobilization protein n=1 Tax=Photobacterium piscicola TaxID=1378299 RepID=UPI002E18733E|nr:hypothetical protein [Photobacterium piscicola]